MSRMLSSRTHLSLRFFTGLDQARDRGVAGGVRVEGVAGTNGRGAAFGASHTGSGGDGRELRDGTGGALTPDRRVIERRGDRGGRQVWRDPGGEADELRAR